LSVSSNYQPPGDPALRIFGESYDRPVKRRAKSEIFCDILTVVSQGTTRPTKIQQRANLTWSNLLLYLDVLLRNEFITREARYGITTYHITSKGKSVVELSGNLRELTCVLESHAEDAVDGQRKPIVRKATWEDYQSSEVIDAKPYDAYTLAGKSVLLEVDPALNYETAVSKIVGDFTLKGHSPFLFSWRGSPVYAKLSGGDGLSLRTMDSEVTTRKKVDNREVLIPQNNHTVLLDELSRVIQSQTENGILLVFDSISDLVISEGLETTYKVLKTVNGLVTGTSTTILAILRRRAHDDRAESMIKGIYAFHVIHDSGGLKLARAG
jgi:predicted transcriptional regulator